MYCPRCGQEKVSGDLRFCSRCGLPLDLVTEFVANGGTLPELAEINKKKKVITRKNGMKFSLIWFIVFVLILLPLLAILGAPEELLGMLAVFGTMSSLLVLVSSFMFLKKEPKWAANENILQSASFQPQRNFQANQTNSALPPQQTQPAQDYISPADNFRAADTGELVQPGSVTEGTTKLLKREKE